MPWRELIEIHQFVACKDGLAILLPARKFVSFLNLGLEEGSGHSKLFRGRIAAKGQLVNFGDLIIELFAF